MTATSLRNIVIRALSPLKATASSCYGRETDRYNSIQTLEVYVKGHGADIFDILLKAMKKIDLPVIKEDQDSMECNDSINKLEVFRIEGEGNSSRWHIYCSGPKPSKIPETSLYD